MTTGGPHPSKYTSADRSLEHALLFCFVIHALAMLAMAGLLIPTLPGGSTASDLTRALAIAEHPWLFRLGWLPWQLSAVADLFLAVAMVRVRWLPRLPAICVLVFTVAAVIPDQYAQGLWITQGVSLAQEGASRGDVSAYLALERAIFPLTAGWGALFYTLAALGWTWCFARGGTWSGALSILSVPLWTTMCVAVVAPLLPHPIRPSAMFVSTANGLGFVQLQIWLGLVTEQVLRRARPTESHGRLAPWRHPRRGVLYRAIDAVANSRLFGALLEPFPEVAVRSDITNVIYVNYLVEASEIETLVPPGLELQRLGPAGRYALFTFLTYQHGHFGFAFIGPLRRLMPSPVQTNWRIHVRDARTQLSGIYFVTNAITHAVPALAARMLTEGMPMHVLDAGTVARAVTGELKVVLDPGSGSAPDATLTLRPRESEPTLEGAWAECWKSWREFLAYCVPQDRAMSSQPLRKRISRQEIDLGISIDACEALEGNVTSRAAAAFVGERKPLCFRVAEVAFTFETEIHDRISITGPARRN